MSPTTPNKSFTHSLNSFIDKGLNTLEQIGLTIVRYVGLRSHDERKIPIEGTDQAKEDDVPKVTFSKAQKELYLRCLYSIKKSDYKALPGLFKEVSEFDAAIIKDRLSKEFYSYTFIYRDLKSYVKSSHSPDVKVEAVKSKKAAHKKAKPKVKQAPKAKPKTASRLKAKAVAVAKKVAKKATQKKKVTKKRK